MFIAEGRLASTHVDLPFCRGGGEHLVSRHHEAILSRTNLAQAFDPHKRKGPEWHAGATIGPE